jgi:hypothetical protein
MLIPAADILNYFRQAWRRDKVLPILGQYRMLNQHKLLLADIALRNGVFSETPRIAGDVIGDGIAIGRRAAALEIIKLSQTDPLELFSLIEKKPTQPGASK